jgi:hypothetical protein
MIPQSALPFSMRSRTSWGEPDVRVSPLSAVIRVALDDDSLAGTVSVDVVGARAGERAAAFGIGGKVRRHRAEERHARPRGKVAERLHEADGQAVPASDHSARVPCPPRQDSTGADDVLHIARAERAEAWGQRPVDRARERPRVDRFAVAEAEAAPEHEGVGLAVAGDLRRPGGNLRREAIRRLSRLVGICHQPRTRQIEERPRRLCVRDRGVHAVELLGWREHDAEGPTPRRRCIGSARVGAAGREPDEHSAEDD